MLNDSYGPWANASIGLHLRRTLVRLARKWAKSGSRKGII